MSMVESAMVFWFSVIYISFLNCIVYRYIYSSDHGFVNLMRFSYCDKCKEQIPLIYVIPIFGFFLSRFKCRCCRAPISIYHFSSEFLSGLLGLFFYNFLQVDGLVLFYLLIVLIAVSIIDAKTHLIPLIFTVPLLIYGLFFYKTNISLQDHVYGALCCFFMVTISMVIVSLIKKENVIAGGDVALFTCAGAWLGLYYVTILILLSATAFIVYALPARLQGRMFIPMGPSISIGFYLCIILQHLS